MSKGLVPPLGTLASAFVAERVNAWAVGALAGPAHAAAALSDGASLVVGAQDPAFGRQVTTALTAAGFDAGYTRDVVGVELAGCAKNAAALAAAAASLRRAQRGRRRRRQGVRRDRRARPPRGLRARDVRRPGRRRRPRRHRAGRGLAQPPRRRDARRGHAGRGHRLRARPDRRGRRVRAAARRARAGRRRRRADAARAGRRDRGRARRGGVDRVADRAATGARSARRRSAPRSLRCMAGTGIHAQGAPRRRVLRALQGAPARRLLVLVLPGGQPPRRRGPHGADVPAGLPALRARAARVGGAAAAAVADPHRPQPGGQLLPRPLAQAADADRRREHDLRHRTRPRRWSRTATT